MKALFTLLNFGTKMSLVAGLAGIMACAEPISSNLSSTCNGSNCADGIPGPGLPEEPSVPLEPITGEITEGLYKSYEVIDIDPEAEMITVRLPIPAIALIPGLYAEALIPGLPGARIEVLQTLDETSGIVLYLPLSYLLDGIDSREPSRLPNGDPLPVITGGELPAYAVALHPTADVEVLVYVGPEAIGVLFWSPFNPYISFSSPIYTEGMQHALGFFHAIPHKRNSMGTVVYPKGGFLLGISLPAELRRMLDNLI